MDDSRGKMLEEQTNTKQADLPTMSKQHLETQLGSLFNKESKKCSYTNELEA